MTLVVLLLVLVLLLAALVVALLWCVRRGVRSRVTLANALRRPGRRRPVEALAFYGDSLTAGAGASQGADYPSLVARFFDARLLTQAAGGATSTQIADRAERAGPPRADVAVVWLGRNNYEQAGTVLADVARVVDLVGARTRFRILGVIPSLEAEETPGTRRAALIDELNDELRARYGRRFVDVGTLLGGGGAEGGPSPAALRSDHVHLNDRGYALVAATVIASVLEDW